MIRRRFIFLILILLALYGDIVFGVARVPIFTLVLCGIVFIYEFISSYIYTSR